MLKLASNEFAACNQRPSVRNSTSTSSTNTSSSSNTSTSSSSSSAQFESSSIKLASSSSASSNKLKSSTIARVPPANKSRLRQPVAAFNEGRATAQQQPTILKQSRLAKPTPPTMVTTAATRARPTSLALKSPSESRVALPTRLAGISSSRLGASTLPKPSQTKTTLVATRQLTTNSGGGGTTISGGKIPTNSKNTITISQSEPASENSISASTQLQSSAKNGSPANKQNLSSHYLTSTKCNSAGLNVEPRSSASRDFIAIVYPQHMQRCSNSSATTTVNNKLVSPTTAKFTSLSANARLESGKIYLNHRNANGRPGRESKQDGGRVVVRHLKTTTAATKATSLNNSPVVVGSSNQQNGNSSLSKKMPTNEDKPTDQFALNIITGSNNNKNLLSVASSSGVLPGDDDKKQHGNNKQSNKRLRSRTHSLGLKTNASTGPVTTTAAAATVVAATTTIAASVTTRETAEADDDASDGDDEDDSERGLKANNCYNHDGAKSTLPKSPATYFKHTTNGQKAINDCLLPKPMGQQVLSLMMLDVGLMPANNCKQQPSPPTKSYVRLQHPMRQKLGATSVKSHFIGAKGGGHLNHERDPINRLNGSSINDCEDYEQCNSHHSLQPAHDMLRSQVRFSNQDNEHFRSYSLPASPRLRVSGQINQRFNGGQVEAVSSALKHCSASNHRSNRPLEFNNSCGLHAAPPILINGQFYHANQDNSTCDNQDSHSVGSSSCSSLNHNCPPLLSLSNQLKSFKFEELVRASSVGLAGIQNDNSNNKKQNCNNQSSYNLNIASSASIVGATKPSSDQVAQVAKQHELLTNDLNCVAERDHSNKIDHAADVRTLSNERSPASKGSSQQIHDHFETSQNRQSRALSNKVNRGDDSSLELQLRRQQQPRSHSISGQEFHSNGGYQRLKQALYTQPQQIGGGAAFDGYNQGYNNMAQSANRAQQIPSPLQQHHLLLGRSPSPLSVNCQTNYGSPQRDCSMKYGVDRQPRNQLHASLECLNTGYSEYHQNHQAQQQHHHQQLQQQIHQQYHTHHQLQHQTQNQNYTASYVLAAPPANTIINQNGDQDLAAAAMGSPSSPYHSMSTNGCGPYSQQTQNLINRAMAQVAQSPLRRIGLSNASSTSGASSAVLNHLSNLNHPIRAGHSSLSLASSSFIIEDKLQNEIRKLQSELKTEKEKNEALNSQLNINSSLMAAFEQSLTTLNTRLRQLTALNEKKDEEIEKLEEQLRALKSFGVGEYKASSNDGETHTNNSMNNKDEGENNDRVAINSEKDKTSEQNLMKLVDDLKRQLIEKDRLLTDTRLEALSAAHQLEQLESKLNGENSLLINEDDLDEGVMVVNHSPSDSDAITDSVHFSEINSQISKPSQRCNGDSLSFTATNNNANENNLENSTENNNNVDYQSNHSSDYQLEIKAKDQQTTMSESVSQQFNGNESGAMSELLDNLLLT